MPHLLSSVLDTGAAEPLRQALLARVDAGDDLLLDGAGVERAGLACLQVLASARASAAAAGLAFGVQKPSQDLTAMVTLAGMDDLLSPLAAMPANRRIAA